MSGNNSFFTKLSFTLSIATTAFLLSGCGNNFGPTSMPTGYVYHDGRHKSVPGPELVRSKIDNYQSPTTQPMEIEDREAMAFEGTAYEPEDYGRDAVTGEYYDYDVPSAYSPLELNSSVIRTAADDLLDKLVMDVGRPVEVVFVDTMGLQNALSQAFDIELRNSMVNRGFILSPVEGQSPFVLKHSASQPSMGGPDDVLFSIMLQSGKEQLASYSGVYSMNSQQYQPQSPSVPQMESYIYDKDVDKGAIINPIPLMPN